MAIPLTVGVALVTAIGGVVAIWFSVGHEDRGSITRLLRHPLKTIFEPDVPDPPSDEDPPLRLPQ
jgi:hypothetical protein